MGKKMPSGTFRLKGRELKEMTERAGFRNDHQVSLAAGVSHPTVTRWFDEAENVSTVKLSALAGILVDAAGLTPEEALELPLGALFDYVANGRRAVE